MAKPKKVLEGRTKLRRVLLGLLTVLLILIVFNTVRVSDMSPRTYNFDKVSLLLPEVDEQLIAERLSSMIQ